VQYIDMAKYNIVPALYHIQYNYRYCIGMYWYHNIIVTVSIAIYQHVAALMH